MTITWRAWNGGSDASCPTEDSKPAKTIAVLLVTCVIQLFVISSPSFSKNVSPLKELIQQNAFTTHVAPLTLRMMWVDKAPPLNKLQQKIHGS